jgi:hypothetical protein
MLLSPSAALLAATAVIIVALACASIGETGKVRKLSESATGEPGSVMS